MFTLLFKKLKLFYLNCFGDGTERSTKDIDIIIHTLREEIRTTKYITDRHYLYKLVIENELKVKELFVKAKGKASVNTIVCQVENTHLISTVEILDVTKGVRDREVLFNNVDASIFKSDYSLVKDKDSRIRDIADTDRGLYSFLFYMFGADIETVSYRKIYKSIKNPKSYAILEIDSHPEVSQAIVNTLMVQLE